MALGILRSLVLSLGRESCSDPIYPQVLSLYGQWLAETRSENPRKILTQCFRKSGDVAVSMNSHKPVPGIEGISGSTETGSFLNFFKLKKIVYLIF